MTFHVGQQFRNSVTGDIFQIKKVGPKTITFGGYYDSRWPISEAVRAVEFGHWQPVTDEAK